MKNLKYSIGIFLVLALLFGCQEDDVAVGDLVAPSNIQIQIDKVGADAGNPNGDGSGTVNFSATADNAIAFHYIIQGETKLAENGKVSHDFTLLGTNTYVVTVIAFGTGGASSSRTVEVDVLSLYDPPADLVEMLYGSGSRTWRLKAEAPGHFGVGPADAVDPIWWAASPNDKDGKGAYDDRWVFNSDGTYSHITNATGYGQVNPMNQDLGDPGLTPNGDNEYENYPLDDYSGTYTLTAPGGQETLSFSGIGYHGFYVGGDHKYKILSRSANEMKLMTVGLDGLGWFAILVAE